MNHIFPVRLTFGSMFPHPAPGWSYYSGGTDSRTGSIVWLKSRDPDGNMWLEWFCGWIGVRIAIPIGLTLRCVP